MITLKLSEGLPVEYETFLNEKYESFITSCHYLKIYSTNSNFVYILVSENDALIHILLFANKGNMSICFNSLADIEQNIITKCTEKLFEAYPFIKKIKIDASYRSYNLDKSFLASKTEDYILKLPATVNDYYSQLGTKTRKHIKQRQERLVRDFPTVNFVTKSGIEIDEYTIDKIIYLNHCRLKRKGVTPTIDAAYKNNIYRYAQHYGFVVCIEIDGEIVAGCISSILNKGIFVHVIAYDNNYSNHNVGEVSAFYLIQKAIEQELSSLHFLWGESELKKRFLAKPHLLYSYFVYRAYCLNYIINKYKALILNILIILKHSRIFKPILNTIKEFRKRLWNQ